MPFLTQGKTNWKYILIVVVLATVVGGGILWFTTNQETPVEEFKEIKIYFYNMDLYNELSEEICPSQYCPKEMYETYGVDDCGPVFPVTRNISKPENEKKLVELSITELKKGPTKEEQEKGFEQKSPFVEMIKGFELKNGILTIVFDEEEIEKWEETIAPRSFESLASCEISFYLNSITKTLGQVGKINFEGIVF